MMSSEPDPFGFDESEKEVAALKFMGQSYRELLRAAFEAQKDKKITRQEMADKLGVHKSVVSRMLSGRGNLTQRTIGEVAWALGYEPSLNLQKIELIHSNFVGKSVPFKESPVFDSDVQETVGATLTSTSSSDAIKIELVE